MRELTSEALFESIRRHEVDFGIGPVIETTEFSFEPLLEESLYALVPKRFVTTGKNTITLATLCNMPLLVLSPATALRNVLEATMRERNLSVSTRYEFSQTQTLISMASAGLGAAILPKVVLPSVIDERTQALRIVSPAMTRKVALITLRGQSPGLLRWRSLKSMGILLTSKDVAKRPMSSSVTPKRGPDVGSLK